MATNGVKFGEYKGSPTLSLPTGNEKYPFTFGLKKARLIIEHIDDIYKFVKDNEGKD